jgi:hypothetical protein
MDALHNTPFDYLEVIFTPIPTQTKTGIGRSYSVSPQDFNMYLGKMKRWPQLKCFQADSKEYDHRDLQLVKKIKDNEVQESKVYQTTPVAVIDEPSYRVIAFEKKKLSTVVFPSSKTYDQIKYKRKLIFRVNNKIYINFQQELMNEEVFHKIYINFNNNKDTDIKDSLATITQYVNDIFSTHKAATS